MAASLAMIQEGAGVTYELQGDEEVGQFLRFGDEVSFFDKSHNGYMHSHLSSSKHSSLSVVPGIEDPRAPKEIGNFQTCVFQVLAHNKYKASRDLQKELDRVRKKERNTHLSLDQAMLKSPNLGHLKQMADAEAADNKLEQKRRHGDRVVYGQLIQLWHNHLQKFVKISSTATSKREATNMKIEMDPNTTKNSWFRIMPRYKVKAEGDYVRVGDQVVLESVKNIGQFVHSSASIIPENEIDAGCHEINLCVNPTAFVLYLVRHPNEADLHFLNSGDIIQLFHKEISAYIAAEGDFASPEPRQDVHLRIRLPDPKRPSRLLPPTSAVSFWQVESDKKSNKNGVILWEEDVRLKHLTTQMYLAINEDKEMHLTRRRDDAGIFRFHAVIREQRAIQMGSYTRIEHISGDWMHAEKSKPIARAVYPGAGPKNELSQRTQEIVWDEAQLCTLGWSPEQMFDDAFIITYVPTEYVSQVNYVAGMIPIILNYITIRAEREVNPFEANLVTSALEELHDYMFVNGTVVKTRQKLIRNLGLVEMLLDVLQTPLKPYNQTPSGIDLRDIGKKQHAATKSVLDAVYSVLEAYLEGSCRKNELYISKHIPFFQTQIGGFVPVEKMYTELVRDNSKIVHTIHEEEIAAFVRLLREDKNPDYLAFLSALCECDDVPIHKNQETICKLLLESGGAAMVYLTELNPARNEVEVSVSGRSDDWQPLKQFAASALDDDDSTSTKEYLFLQEQLRLFGQLCLGRNMHCINIITQKLKYLTWSECFHCAQNEGLPKGLRAMYVALMVNLFVDIPDNVDILEDVQLVYDWGKLTDTPNADASEDRTQSLSGSRLEFFPQLHDWLLKFLRSQTSINASDQAENRLIAEILRLLLFLVKFGFYAAPEDIKTLMGPLLGILDGQNDVASESTVTFANDLYAKEWKNKGRFQRNADNVVVMEVKFQALEVVDALLNFTLSVRLQHFLYDFKSVADWSGDRRDTRSKNALIKPGEPILTFNQMRALQALARTSENTQVLEFTEDVRDYLRDLWDRSNWVCPGWHAGDSVTSPASLLVAVLLDLGKYDDSRVLTSSVKLLNRLYSAQNNLFQYTTQTQVVVVPDSIQLMKSLTNHVATLRRLGAGLVEGEDIDEFSRLCDMLGSYCYLADGEPHPQNQTLLLNSGIMSVLFDVVDYDEQSPGSISASFRLMRALALHNHDAQKMLFDRIDTLLAVEGSDNGWQNDMAFALTEVFTNNQQLCLAVKARSVEKMMELLAEQAVEAPNLLRLLQAVTKVEEMNIPLKRNQALIAKYLMQYRDRIVAVAYIDDASDDEINRQRLELLRNRGFNTPLLDYHLELVALLAACAEGENRFIESMCQTIFSVDEVLQVLLDREIDSRYKTAYMKFFLWVYLNTAGSPLEVGTYGLPLDARLWNFLKAVAEDQIASFCIAEPLTAEQSNLTFNAFVPILTKVVRSFYQPNEYPHSTSVLREVAAILSDFVSRALPRIYDREQVKCLSACLMAVSSAEKGCVSQAVLGQLGSKLTQSEAGLLESDAMHDYHRKYQKQAELNAFLNTFAHSVRMAYEGPNTIEAQLGEVPGLAEDEADNDYAEDETEDEYLPLGPEFQAFVSLFWKPHSQTITEHVRTLVRVIAVSNRLGATLAAKDKTEQDQVDIRSLQILRALIHNRIQRGESFVEVQDQLCETRMVLPVTNMLHNANTTVVREALACLAAVLKDGNKKAQALFEEHFLGTREESFFDDIQNHMRRSVDSMVETRILIRQTREERDRQRQLMGTMTMAGALGGQLQSALADVEAAEQRYDAAAPAGFGKADSQGTYIELQAVNPAVGGEQQQSKKYEDEGELQFDDENTMELVLRVLQLLCEGHRAVLQNYLRSQPDNIRSIDLVAETARFLQALVEEVNEENIELVIQTVETLVEFAQGCQGNQGTIFDSRTIDQVNHLLRLPEFPGCSPNKIAALKLTCGNLVLSMLEDSDEATQTMAKELEETFDIGAAFKALQEYYEISETGIDQDDDAWGVDEDAGEEPVAAVDVAYAFYNVIKRLQDFSGKPYNELPDYNPFLPPELGFGAGGGEGDDELGDEHLQEADKKEEEEEEKKVDAFASLAERSVVIEILREGRLQKIHFLDRWKKHLRPEVKEDLLWHVDRSSPADKVRDYVERCRKIMADISYLRSVQEGRIINQLVMNHSALWSRGLLLLTFVLNILIILSWEASPDWTEPRPEFNNSAYEPLLFILGALHLFLSLVVSFGYFLVHPPSFRGLLETIPFGSYVQKLIPEDESGRTLTSILSIESIHHILLVVFSLLGLLFDGYFFAYHLLHVIVNNDILLRVIQSVTKNGISLLWVAALMVIVIYIYSLVAFAFLRKNFDESEGAYCQDMVQCFTSSLKLGLLSGGGLGEALPPETLSFHETGLRIFFDLSFFIIVTVIGLNVVFGIIVDTFSELRDEKYQTQEAMESECFICSLKNYDFERFGNGFHHHVKHEHNMWNYLFYMMHLDEKDSTEYTSNEQFVADALRDGQETAFFPINRALALDKRAEEGMEDRLGAVESSLRELIARFDASEERAAEERRRAEQRQAFLRRQTET